MISKTLKICFGVSALALTTLCNALSGGFTTEKGTYEFSIEYAGDFQNNSDGQSGKIYGQAIEINNDFGITDNQSVSLDLFFNKSDALNNGFNFDKSSTDTTSWLQAFQVRHRMNFNLNKSINFGLQNAFFIKETQDSTDINSYSRRWEIRGMVKHDNDTGFYKNSGAELLFRRNFAMGNADVARLDLKTKFRLANSVDFFVKVETYFLFASQGYIDNNMESATNKRINNYFSSFKTSEVALSMGPEFSLSNGDSVYFYYTMQVDASSAERNHSKGFAIGYSRSMDFNNKL